MTIIIKSRESHPINRIFFKESENFSEIKSKFPMQLKILVNFVEATKLFFCIVKFFESNGL